MTPRTLRDRDLPGLLALLTLQDDTPALRAMAPEGRTLEELEVELGEATPFGETSAWVLADEHGVHAYVGLCSFEGETFLEGPLMTPDLAVETVLPLLTYALTEARAQGLGYLEAFVDDANSRAQEALTRLGFAPFRTTYLYEIARDAAPRPVPRSDVTIDLSGDLSGGLGASQYRDLYRDTNDAWSARLTWSDEELTRRFHDSNVKLIVAYQAGAPVGHVELEWQDSDLAEVAYFGVLPQARGRGLGYDLLALAVHEAFKDADTTLVMARAHDDERHACHTIERVGFHLARGVVALTLEL